MKEIVITEEGAFLRTIETSPIANETLLRNYLEVEDKLTFTPKVIAAGNHVWDLYTRGREVYAATELKVIHINARWTLEEDNKVRFCTNDDDPTAVQATMTIPVEDWYACIFDRCLHIAVHRDGQIYRPPIPNFFDNGKMCRGDNGMEDFPAYSQLIEELMNVCNNAPFNTDLWHNPCRGFLKGELNPSTGELIHRPEGYELTEVIGGRLAEIYEHQIQ